MSDLLENIFIEDRTGTSPVMFHAPHGSQNIPHRFHRDFLVNSATLSLEHYRMVDHRTDELAWQAANATSASVIRSDLSRLVVDVEKFLGAREELFVNGMSAFYTRTAYGYPLRQEPLTAIRYYDELLDYYEAYGRAFSELVSRALEVHGRAVIVDVHSYPQEVQGYELHRDDHRPQIDLGTDPFHTPAWLIEAAREAFGAFECKLNQPFTGTYVPLDYYGVDPRVSSIMLEMRRDKVNDQYEDVQRALVEIARKAKLQKND
jgi:N-formylglutamate amidohydrolase